MALAAILVPKFLSNGDGAPPWEKDRKHFIRINLGKMTSHYEIWGFADEGWLNVMNCVLFLLNSVTRGVVLVNMKQISVSVCVSHLLHVAQDVLPAVKHSSALLRVKLIDEVGGEVLVAVLVSETQTSVFKQAPPSFLWSCLLTKKTILDITS